MRSRRLLRGVLRLGSEGPHRQPRGARAAFEQLRPAPLPTSPTVAFELGAARPTRSRCTLADLLTSLEPRPACPALDPVRALRRTAGRPAADRAGSSRRTSSSAPATRSSGQSASTSSRSGTGERQLGAGHRARDPRPPEDADEDVLPLPGRLLRAAEHADLPGLPRVPGGAAGAEPQGGRRDDQARAGARLRDRRRGPSSTARTTSTPTPEGVPDLPVRRTALRRRAPGRARRPTATRRSGSCGPISRRTRRRPFTSAASEGRFTVRELSGRLQPRGSPLVEIVTAPDLRTPEQAKRFLQLLRQTVVELESPTRRWRRARSASTSTCRCGRKGRTSCGRGPS